MASIIHYKFRASSNWETLNFRRTVHFNSRSQEAVLKQKFNKHNFKLMVFNIETGEEYQNENEYIPKNSSVEIRRTPIKTYSDVIISNKSDVYDEIKDDICPSLFCTLCNEIFSDTIVTVQCCYRAYDQTCLIDYLKSNEICPCCKHNNIEYKLNEKLNNLLLKIKNETI